MFFKEHIQLIFLTLRLNIRSFWAQTKFSGQISLEIGKGVAWPPSLKKLGTSGA